MHSLVLCLSLLGQAPADPGVPWQSEAGRQQWIKNMRFQRAFAESQARKSRIAYDNASGASVARHYPGLYDPYVAQRQMLNQQYFANQQLYLQQQRLNGGYYRSGYSRPRYYGYRY